MLPFKVLGLKWVKLDYHNFIISNTSVLLTILLILYWLQGTQSKENVSMFWKTWRIGNIKAATQRFSFKDFL